MVSIVMDSPVAKQPSVRERPRRRGLGPLVRASWAALGPSRPRFFLFVGLFVAANVAELLVPWALGYTIGVFVEHGFTRVAYEGAMLGIACYLGLRFANILLHHLGRYVQSGVAYQARMHTLGQVFAALLGYGLHWHVERHTGENLAKLNRSALAVSNVVGQYSWQVLEGTVKVALASLALAALDAVVAVNVVVMSVATLAAMMYFNRRLVEHIRATNQFDNKIGRVCVDYLANVVTVKTLSLERAATSELASHREEGHANVRRMSRFSELKWAAVNAGYALVMATSLLWYFHGAGARSVALDVAQVYVLISYLDKIFSAIGSFSAYYGNIVEAGTAYEDASELLAGAPPPSPPRPRRRAAWREVTLRELSFSYGGDDRGLRCRGIALRRGEKVALVGSSGGGKSTLLKLLSGILRPHSCMAVCDGRATTIEELAAGTLLIPQEPQIFSDTLRYNVTLGEEPPPGALGRVVALARLEPILAKLPAGWDTHLAESGLNLSGGERQRIALARGLLRAETRDLLLLDEPTAALDPRTEREVLAAIFAALPDTTIVASCHRWSLLPLFDRVLYVEDGEVHELQLHELPGAEPPVAAPTPMRRRREASRPSRAAELA
jgi:ATP-binding cassette subfamily B protein